MESTVVENGFLESVGDSDSAGEMRIWAFVWGKS